MNCRIGTARLPKIARWPIVLFGFASTLIAAGPAIPIADVFVAGQEGYHRYRIPAVIRARNGDLLAFCEGRKYSGSDSSKIDLLLKRSRDAGRTWSSAQVVWADGDNTCGNPCPVLDGATGAIWLLATHNLGTDHEKAIIAGTGTGTRTVWIAHSTDDGATWSGFRDITATAKDRSWGWYATAPGIGIQIRHGPHAGRLVIPCDHSYNDPAAGRHRYGSHAIFSDDHGRTWKLGGVIRPDMNECQVAELPDGRGTLLMSMRPYTGRKLRSHATSRDGGLTWSEPTDVFTLVDSVCQASLIWHESGQLLFSNPASAWRRVNLTVRASADGGQGWRDLLVLEPGPAAYSCLVSLSTTEAGCLFERGREGVDERIVFARFGVPAFADAAGARLRR
jgi:sialidase-1